MKTNVQPRISIVTPSFNQGAFLEQTMQSVLSQNYPNLEYVVIDGGSTDESLDIIKRYEDKLSCWVSEKDAGHGHALNKGFSRTTGEIMAWINSDDMYTPWAFQVAAEVFSLFPHVMWIVGFNSWWNSAGAMIKAARVPKNIFDFLSGDFGWIQQESVFWRRELWNKAGAHINQDYNLMVDGELWTRFFLHEPLYTVDCILSGYRTHAHNRAKHNYAECLREMENAISEMRKKCPADVLMNCRKLDVFRQLKKRCIPQRMAAFIEERAPCAALAQAAYRNIAWEHESWVERTLPYSP